MGQIRKAVVSATLLVLLAGFFANPAPAAAARPAAAPPAPLDLGVVRQVVDEMVSLSGTPGSMAQVWDGAKGRYGFAAGVANRDTRRPMRSDLVGRVGGSTMTFVTAVVLQLVAEGKLGLDDGIEKYVPGLVPWGRQVTVRMLLNHTSGIYDHLQLPRFADKELYLRERWKTFRPEELVAMAVAEGKVVEPGEWYFSYTNFTIIGMVIQKVTGQSAQQEVTRRVIQRLGLKHTYFPTLLPLIPFDHARGYFNMGEDGWIDVTALNPTAAGAARGLISNVPDLLTFWRALLVEGKLVNRAMLAEMLDFLPVFDPGPGPSPIPDIRAVHQGLGIIRIDYSCGTSSYGSHGAAMHGYDTTVHVSADGSRAASAMTNEYTDDQRQGPVLVPFLIAAFCGTHSYPIPPGSN